MTKKARTRCFLKKIESKKGLYMDNGDVKAEYIIAYNDLRITVDQTLILTQKDGKWKADMQFDGFPEKSTPQEAALKLSEWMKKMSIAIKKGKFNKIDLNKL